MIKRCIVCDKINSSGSKNFCSLECADSFIREKKNKKLDWTWLITILSLIGVVMNIYKLEECFYIWCFTNFVWMVIDWKKEIYSQAFLYFVMFLLAIWGILVW